MRDANSGDSPSPPSDPAPPRARVSRPIGVTISLVTGLVVALVGNAVIPSSPPKPSEAPGAGSGPIHAAAGDGPSRSPTANVNLAGEGPAVADHGASGTASTTTTDVPAGAVPAAALTPAPNVPSKPVVTAAEDKRSAARAGDPSIGPAHADPAGPTTTPEATRRGEAGHGAEVANVAVAEAEGNLAPDAHVASAPSGPTGEHEKSGDKLAQRSSTDARPEDVPEAAKDAAKESTAESAAKEKSDQKLAPGDEHAAPDCTLPDKDIAREAWRRNSPTLCRGVEDDRVSLFIPLKGTLDGETHELRQAIHEVRINLPAGESLLTLRQYKVRRSGFKDLRIIPTDSGGTHLRLKVSSSTGEASFDMKDGYAKITIPAPRASPSD